jgi:hypothetical protein
VRVRVCRTSRENGYIHENELDMTDSAKLRFFYPLLVWLQGWSGGREGRKQRELGY